MSSSGERDFAADHSDWSTDDGPETLSDGDLALLARARREMAAGEVVTFEAWRGRRVRPGHIEEALIAIAEEPFGRSRPVANGGGARLVRVGAHRIVFDVDEASRHIAVRLIGPSARIP